MGEKNIIIGLTGSFGSGCSAVANYLQQKGFLLISISSILEKIAVKEGHDFSRLLRKERRTKLQDLGNELRKKDSGILIREGLKNVDLNKDIVINSIKNPGEIEELKKIPNSYVIAIDTSFDVRVKRILKKEYDDDLGQFKKDNLREGDEGIEYGQKLQKCVDLSDVIIKNDEQINNAQETNEFVNGLMGYVRLMKEPGYRPPTEIELWMNNAYSISLQSSCIKRKVGAVIIKKGYVVAAGNNNPPSEEKTCKEVYDDKCYRDILKNDIRFCPICGKGLNKDFSCKDIDCKYNENELLKLFDKCRSLHAEESAILQAASLGGTSLEGSLIYTTTFPCRLCANKIIAVGIKEVVYVEAYPDQDSVDFLNKSKVRLTKFEGVKAASFYKLFSKA